MSQPSPRINAPSRLLWAASAIALAVGVLTATVIGGLREFRGSYVDRALRNWTEANLATQDLLMFVARAQVGLGKPPQSLPPEVLRYREIALDRLDRLSRTSGSGPDASRVINRVRAAERAYFRILEAGVARKGMSSETHTLMILRERLWPTRVELQHALSDLANYYHKRVDYALASADWIERTAIGLVGLLTAIAILTLVALIWLNNRLLRARVKEEDLVRQRDSYLRQALDAIPQMVWVTDARGNNIYVNQRCLEFSGKTFEESLGWGWGWLEPMHPDFIGETLEIAKRSMVTGFFEAEYKMKDREGNFRWQLARALPMRDAQGNIVQWFGTCTDIEDKKRAEEQLARLFQREKEARMQAELAVRHRDEVLAIVSHDLKNPLLSIMLKSDLMRSVTVTQPRERETVQAAAGVIYRAASRMNDLIQGLLDIALIESGNLRVHPEEQRLAPILADLREIFEPLAQERGIRIDWPDADACPSLLLDRERFFQILSNLLGNAIKFTPEDGRVGITIDSCPEEIRFEVQDNGPGIDSASLPHIFDRFWQARSGSRNGVGLGLAIARGLVEAHGGRIEVRSAPGQGSCFRFTIPRPPGPQAVSGLRSQGQPAASDARLSP